MASRPSGGRSSGASANALSERRRRSTASGHSLIATPYRGLCRTLNCRTAKRLCLSASCPTSPGRTAIRSVPASGYWGRSLGCCGGEHGGDRVSIAFCHAEVSITSRARLTACRSPDLPRRRQRCRVGPGAGPRDNENCGNSLGARRSYEHSRRTDQRTAYTNPVANDLFETNSCAAGTARQSRPGGRATRWSLPTADGTGAGVPTPSTSGASLPVPPAPRPGGTAEYAGLPHQPTRPAMAP